MYNFGIQLYSTYKGLFGWLNPIGYVTNVVLRPIVIVLLYAVLGRFARNPEVAQEYALGVSVLTMSMVIGSIAQTYVYDRQQGTLSFLFLTPVNRLTNYLSRAILHFPNGLIAFTCALTTAWLIVDLDFTVVGWAGFIVSVLVTAASLVAFGQFLGVLIMRFQNWVNVFILAYGVLFALSGIIIPITVFPGPVQEFCKLLPITNGLSAVRAAFAGAAFSEFSDAIIREFITGLAYLAIGYIRFLLIERNARRTGYLQQDIM